METIGSILHGAYGDYYEQLLCLQHYKRTTPGIRLALFFASAYRRSELRVFDVSFADEVHGADAIGHVPVDRFWQFQIRDAELQQEVLANLAPSVRARFDFRKNRKPWSILRGLDFRDPANQLALSPYGRQRLPEVMRENELDEGLFGTAFTVGFLWRQRTGNGAVSSCLQTDEETVLRTKAELFARLIRDWRAHVLVCGMNVRRTEENYRRIEAKYTAKSLGLPADRCTYLKGLSWGLELEILSRCSLCLVMPSGFSEALWMKRTAPTLLLDAPPHYLAMLLWNRMPFFNVLRPRELWFQLRQPHTADRVLGHLRRRHVLPHPQARTGVSVVAGEGERGP